MVVYLDIVFIVNFLFDFMILFTCREILKIRVSILRLLFGSLIGSLTIFSLFIKFNSITLFFYKVFISFIIVLITFGKEKILRKIYYFYFISIILGGTIYLIKIQLSYENSGLIVFKNNISTSLIFYLFITPFVFKSYLKELTFFKIKNSIEHEVVMVIENKMYKYTGYIDTGNSLYDPLKKRPVLILNDQYFKFKSVPIYVPFNTLDGSGVIPCIKIDELYIDNEKVKNTYLLGISNKKIKIKNVKVSIILHKDLLKL